MRCPGCNKFASYDTDVEPEENASGEIEGTTFTASYRRVLTCAECGEELKEAEIELEYDFSGEILEPKTKKGAEHEHEFDVDSCEAEATTESVTKDRTGRTITNPRYMATLYGVSCHVEVSCGVDGCTAAASFDVSDNVRASSMDELT